jgi:hypothetical protein
MPTRAREPLAAKPVKYTKQQRMFPGFPGFNPDHTFRSLLVFEERNIRALSPRALKTFESKTAKPPSEPQSMPTWKKSTGSQRRTDAT